ncbi:LysR family transcriptional regulator [Nocardia alni]|uniref:LysR family transcriptional regulator n=1 Tax=Nocardia alni TaxID=2815723 RepID=UPI0020B17B6C|nr:LysR family transcriptional regulator [Nocardia alni]
MREIEAFLAVAAELHFGRAAQRLHLTTTSVSQAVRTLERRVGAPLFERTSRRVVLTALGEQLRAKVEPAFAQLHDAVSEAQRSVRLPYRDTLRVTVASSLSHVVGKRISDEFRAACPDCELIKVEYDSGELLRWLDGGFFVDDVCVARVPEVDPLPLPDWVAVGPLLFRESRVAFMSPRHPLARRASLDVEDLADWDVMRAQGYGPYADAWTPARTPSGRPVRRVQQTRWTYLYDISALLADGTLLHVSTPAVGDVLGSDLVARPITGLPSVRVTLLWSRHAAHSRITEFAAAAANAFAESRSCG